MKCHVMQHLLIVAAINAQKIGILGNVMFYVNLTFNITNLNLPSRVTIHLSCNCNPSQVMSDINNLKIIPRLLFNSMVESTYQCNSHNKYLHTINFIINIEKWWSWLYLVSARDAIFSIINALLIVRWFRRPMAFS